MNDLLVRLFGLRELRPGAEGVRFDMAHDLPAWVWAPVVVLAVAVSLWSYWRLEGSRKGRLALAITRGALLIALAVLAAGPRLIRDNERIERDRVVVLLDRSASLTIPDAGGGREREAQLAEVLRDPAWASLADAHELLWLGFDAGAYEIGDPAAELEPPTGARTRLGPALADAVARVSGQPVSGVVVVSDGRTSDAPDARLMRELTAQKIGVFPVPLGSERALLDLALERVEAPTSAFVEDFVPVTARLVARGEAADAAGATVELVDLATGEVLDTQELTADAWRDGVAEARLATRPDTAGEVRWAVRVSAPAGDVLESNNEREVRVELVEKPLRVAYFEGYPRWEYRYVKDLLVREDSVRSSVMLLASDRRYIQEGDVGMAHVPRSSGEWSEFDVVVLGDVRPDVFSREQLEQLRDHVAQRGGGLVWIAGPGATPWAWGETPLGELLPFTARIEGGVRGFAPAGETVTLRPEPAAERLGVLMMAEDGAGGWPDVLSDPRTGWSVLRWSLAIASEAVKPTADVLASAVGASGAAEAAPCVLTMRYGAGRVVFVGTDELWRWRYARGGALHERFYLPLVRLAGRGSLSRGGRSVVLDAAPTAVVVETPVTISATLLDQSLVDAAPPAVEVRISRAGDDGEPGARIKLGAEGAGEQAASYGASWVASEPGAYVVETVDPLLASAGARAEFRVLAPDDEMRTPEADHALLADLAERTGGAVVPAGELDRLADLLPNRSIVIEGEPDVETLWDRPIVLAVLVLLLTGEWVGRRLLRLV